MSLARCNPSYPGLSAWDGTAASTAELRGPQDTPPLPSPWGMKILLGQHRQPHACEVCWIPMAAFSRDGCAHPLLCKAPEQLCPRVQTAVQNKESFTWEMQKFPEQRVMLQGKQSVFSCLLVREKAEKGKQVLLLETATF